MRAKPGEVAELRADEPIGLDALRPEHRELVERLGKALKDGEPEPLREEAGRLYTETREYLAEESFANVLVLCSIGKFWIGIGEVREATKLLEHAMEIARAHHSAPGDPTQGMVAQHLAGLYTEQGRFEDARPLFEKALELSQSTEGKSSPSTLALQNGPGDQPP